MAVAATHKYPNESVDVAFNTIGQVVGCVAILLNPIAGCILGTIIGAGIGAAVGIVRDGSENLQPALFEFFSTFQP